MSLHNFMTNIPVAKRDISVWIIVMDQPTDKNSVIPRDKMLE